MPDRLHWRRNLDRPAYPTEKGTQLSRELKQYTVCPRAAPFFPLPDSIHHDHEKTEYSVVRCHEPPSLPAMCGGRRCHHAAGYAHGQCG